MRRLIVIRVLDPPKTWPKKSISGESHLLFSNQGSVYNFDQKKAPYFMQQYAPMYTLVLPECSLPISSSKSIDL